MATYIYCHGRGRGACGYVQRVLGVRPDVLVLDTRLAQYRWYRMKVAQRHNRVEQLCQAFHNSAAPTVTINVQAVQQADGVAWRMAQLRH